MAIGWIAALKMVPWADVVSNAPVVADGAKKLWNVVSRKKADPEVTPRETATNLSTEAIAMRALETRAAVLESKVADLEHEMISSSEVIKSLAEQNAKLIQMLDLFRRRQQFLMLVSGVLVVAVAACLLLFLAR